MGIRSRVWPSVCGIARDRLGKCPMIVKIHGVILIRVEKFTLGLCAGSLAFYQVRINAHPTDVS
jgi:hypothetical protein